MRIAREHADVVVVGARCAGSATAMLLARMGYDVAVVDRATFPRDTLSTHGIARGGVVQLARWGLLDQVLDSGAPAVRQATFVVGGEQISRRVKERAGVDLLVAPRRHVLDALLARAATDAGARLVLGTTIDTVVHDLAGRAVGVSGHRGDGSAWRIDARYVVGADGLRSSVARLVGASVIETHPRDSAAFYTYVTGLDDRGFEFHLGSGGLAGVFPTHDGQSCVWLCSPAELAAGVRCAGGGRRTALLGSIAALSPSLGERLRTVRDVDRVRGAVDLPNLLRQSAGPGWLLVGDAGCHRDPITGHGITDAFRDAEYAARALEDALSGRVPEAQALATYQTRRDDAVRDVFDLTCELATYPPPHRFVQLQRQLSEALDREALDLASLATPEGRHVVAS